MKGSLTVVPDQAPASDPRAVQFEANIQHLADTVGALGAEIAAERGSVSLNPDGKTHTITMTAGMATPFVEVAEMLPKTVNVHDGDTVKWVTKSIKDPHTVTFPKGSGSDPLPPFCETGAGVADTPAAAPPSPPCADLSKFEVHFVPQPQTVPPVGPPVISGPSTEATSGVIDTFATTPSPDNYSFMFPNSGTFAYECRIHDHMIGVVVSTK
jgi:plastocyanin